eukprot:scaffold492_cov257-Pinguiococcus_pyrenoidosus.AAC.22
MKRKLSEDLPAEDTKSTKSQSDSVSSPSSAPSISAPQKGGIKRCSSKAIHRQAPATLTQRVGRRRGGGGPRVRCDLRGAPGRFDRSADQLWLESDGAVDGGLRLFCGANDLSRAAARTGRGRGSVAVHFRENHAARDRDHAAPPEFMC